MLASSLGAGICRHYAVLRSANKLIQILDHNYTAPSNNFRRVVGGGGSVVN